MALTPHPFRHPAHNAERIATVDLLSRGRVGWGAARSTALERFAFGVKDYKSRAQWEEAVETIVKAWEQETLAVDIPFLKVSALPRGDSERATIPKPYQDEEDMIIIGDVDECQEKVERYQRVGCDAILCYVQFGHLTA